MFLRYLQLNVSSAAAIPIDFDASRFGASLRAVVNAYETKLPKRSIVLGDAKKINVHLGPRPEAGVFAHADFGIFPDGIGWVWIKDFNLSIVSKASIDVRQKLLLNALHQGVVELAMEMDSDSKVFEHVRDIVAEMIPIAET